MLDGKKPENDCSIYLNHSNGILYDLVLDVNADDSTESISRTSLSDDMHNFEAKKETVTKQQSKNTSHSEQKQTESTFVTLFGKTGLNEDWVEPFFIATHLETLKCIQKHSQCILKRLQCSPTEIENVPYH